MKKLQLQRETLQVLTPDHSAAVAGGGTETTITTTTITLLTRYTCPSGGSGTGGSRYNCPQPQ